MNSSHLNGDKSQLDSAFSFDSEAIEQLRYKEVGDLIHTIMNLKVALKQEKQSNKTMMQNLKAVAYRESISFLKEKSEDVSLLMTKNHKKIVGQFQEYKKYTNHKLMEYEAYWAQEYLRQKNITELAPVQESEYHIQRIKNMSLYDCLVPRLKVLKKP